MKDGNWGDSGIGYLQGIRYLNGLNDFQVYADQLIYFQDGKLHNFHLQSLLSRPLKLPPGISATDKIRVQKNKLFVLKSERVEVYVF